MDSWWACFSQCLYLGDNWEEQDYIRCTRCGTGRARETSSQWSHQGMLGTFAWVRSRESRYHLHPSFCPGAQHRRATLIANADDATSYDNCTAGLVRIGRWFPSRSTEFVQADWCRPIPGRLRRDEESKRNCASFGHPVSKAAMALDQNGQNLRLRASNSRLPNFQIPNSHPFQTYFTNLVTTYYHVTITSHLRVASPAVTSDFFTCIASKSS